MDRMTFGMFASLSRRGLIGAAMMAPVAAAAAVAGVPGPGPKAAANVMIAVRTSAGAILIDVLASRSPRVSRWFLEQVDAGRLDGTSFFRAGFLRGQQPRPRFLEGGMLAKVILGATGAPPATLAEAGLPLFHDWETTATSGLRHVRGAVSLARDITGQGGAVPDLVIALESVAELDAGGGYSPQNSGFPVFGQVVAGMELVDAIAARPRDGTSRVPFLAGQILTEPVRIEQVVRQLPALSRAT